MAVLPTTAISTASTFFSEATDLTFRNRPMLAWLDHGGRIVRDQKGKDANWLVQYRKKQAGTYTRFQDFEFSDEEFYKAMSVTHVWLAGHSGMDITQTVENDGDTAIVREYLTRMSKCVDSLQVTLSRSLYADSSLAANAGLFTGIGSFMKALTTCTTNDLIAQPGTTYAGQPTNLGYYGGSWSSDIPSGQRPSTQLGNDWPDGHGLTEIEYDWNAPRLYNENTPKWGGTTATWRDNCLNMLSRANVDILMNSSEAILPTMHTTGSTRMAQMKSKLRENVREILPHQDSKDIGYAGETINFEGSVVALDHECPADRTYSLNLNGMLAYFMGTPDQTKVISGGDMVTGGIFFGFGPERVSGSGKIAWVVWCGGNVRYVPKYFGCHKDWTV
mgnify:FL=1